MSNPASEFIGLVLLFSNVAAPKNAARLHKEGCEMVRISGKGTFRKIVRVDGAENIASEVEDLIERGYPVLKCKCCR